MLSPLRGGSEVPKGTCPFLLGQPSPSHTFLPRWLYSEICPSSASLPWKPLGLGTSLAARNSYLLLLERGLMGAHHELWVDTVSGDSSKSLGRQPGAGSPLGIKIERAKATVREGDLFLHVDGIR